MIQYELSLAPFMQMFFLAVCFWLLFDTPFLWSLVICSFTIVYALFQGIIMLIAVAIGFATSDSLDNKLGFDMYSVQIFCAIICYFFGRFLLERRIGFLFVPTSRDVPFEWSKMGQWLFIGSLASFLSMGIAYISNRFLDFRWFIALLLMLSMISIVLFILMKRKDQEYADQSWNH